MFKDAATPVAAVEFKSASDPSDEDLEGLIAFAEDFPQVPRFCFCLTPRSYELPSGIQVLPWRDGLAHMRNLEK